MFEETARDWDMSYSQNLRQWKVVFEASLFFGNWAEAWKTIIHSSKNDNVCLCWSWSSVILCLTAQVIQCISYERSKRQNLFFINRCVVMVCVWQPFWFWHLLIFHVSSSNASSFPQDNTTTFQTKGFPIDFSRIIALFVYFSGSNQVFQR